MPSAQLEHEMNDMNAEPRFGTLGPLRDLEKEFAGLEKTLQTSRREKRPMVAVAHVIERLAATRAACENVENELDTGAAAKLSGRTKATIRRWCEADERLASKSAGQWVVDRDRLLAKIGGPVRIENTKEAA